MLIRRGIAAASSARSGLARLFPASVVGLILAFIGTTVAVSPSPALAGPKPGSTNVNASASCEYVVIDDWTPVQDNPNVNATVLEYRWSTDRVYGPCWEAYDSGSGVWFVAVNCTCSPNGFGWIRSYWVLH
ncbi:hypothetical protein ACIBJE_04000 [Micromonospora sp. NPDC050187]|uniref:hypothetical protein n=1 Tax=Micromonospora sp. NPDC050187 TaxID=3364277 RepID=UPI00379949F3